MITTIKKKYPLWFYFVLILIPILVIISVEFSLRYFKYGINLEQWYSITKDKLILNPEIGARYFLSTKDYPHSNHEPFDKEKKTNSFRVFVLGGSSTAGFPYSPNGSFSRYIRDILEYNFPNNTIEVINLGITAVNTYTILDLLPEIIEQSPDLIIIYAGHNEYYGALGVASTESLGQSPFLINTYLYLNKFKTFELLKNVIKNIRNLLAPSNHQSSGTTLMARMAKEQTIEFNSSLFNKGIEQFENNLDKILFQLNQNNIPIIIGNLVSNIKDQKPFINTTYEGHSAFELFSKGIEEFNKNNIRTADSLLRKAKDLDGLRFRAPEIFNQIIKNLASKYKCELIDFEKEFKILSQNGIVGDDLFIDHLHPSLNGYMLMGKLIFNKMIESKFLPNNSAQNIDVDLQDKIILKNFSFTRLDSTTASFRILNLLNDWPFVRIKNQNIFNNIELKDKIDSLAYKMVKENLDWREAHNQAYLWYLSKNDYLGFSNEIKVIVSQYPYKLDYYNYGAEQLIAKRQYKLAFDLLEKKYKKEPDGFSTKWLGNISLFNNDIYSAIKYLSESINFDKRDAQNYYNLTLAFIKNGEKTKALTTITECLKINPNYPQAQNLYNQLRKK